MTLAAAPGRFQYGWVRGGASAAFIVGSVSAGQVVAAMSLGGIVWMNGTLLALAAVAALWLLASYGARILGYEQPRAARWL
jgi:MFS transporter, PPP family, 3-phenylpropionic acid transporter